MSLLPDDLWARAERFLPAKLRPRVYNAEIRPHWLDDHRFWYHREAPDGASTVLVDAETGQRETIPQPHAARPGPASEKRSPDGKASLFLRDHDLWRRDTADGNERRLTRDGAPHYAYGKSADMNLTTITLARKGITLPPAALWSPDSRRILTYRLDERALGDFPMVQHVPEDGSARPILWPLKLALTGDAALPMLEYIAIEAATGAVTRMQGPPSIGGVATAIERGEAWWSADSRRAFVTDRDRHSRRLTLVEYHADTGARREVLTETAPTFIDTNLSVTGLANIAVLDRSDELVWFSQRDGWAHLYLYDLGTGALKNRITAGEWAVRDIVRIDEDRRQVWFLAGGIASGADPTYRALCRVGLDGSNLTVLTPEPEEHAVAMPAARMPRDFVRPATDPGQGISPDFRFFVHTHSTLERAPVSTLRRADGGVVAELETASLDPALQASWRWPQVFSVKADDGATDLFGAMWLPTDFDPSHRYPVLDWIYPGPQRGQTPKVMLTDGPDLFRSAMPQAFAEIGCIVLNVDGRGTPLRAKAFHDVSYGNLGDPGCLADHIAGLRALAQRHDFIDLDRVGIMGHSAGGYATVRAMAAHPDFFRVGVASAGNHDQRGYGFAWPEKHQGPAETADYDAAANKNFVESITGKLFLASGEMDDNVHPALTLQLVDALIKADKDFELLFIPNEDHGSLTSHPYFLRRAMGFLHQHLVSP